MKIAFLKKTRSRQCPPETVIDAEYVDDLVLLANTPAQTESLLMSLEQTAEGISLRVNTNEQSIMF